MKSTDCPSYLTPLRPAAGGLWVDDDFLWDHLPRLTPMAVYVYLALGRYQRREQYPTVEELTVETGRPRDFIKRALEELRRTRLLNDGDVAFVFGKVQNTESESDSE